MHLTVIAMLGLALVHGAPTLLKASPASNEASSPDLDALKLCEQLGLNSFVKIVKELNLTQKLEINDTIGKRLFTAAEHSTKNSGNYPLWVFRELVSGLVAAMNSVHTSD